MRRLWEWMQDPNGFTLVGGRWTDHLGREMPNRLAKEIDRLA